jgi:class 3 adenylate cyclase/predicted ATPase
MQCPSCRADIPLNQNFCLDCGAELSVVACLICGSANPRDARFCGECGAALSAVRRRARPNSTTSSPAPVPLVGTSEAERRQLTVLFCDLVGSTALSTHLDPEDVREIINAYRRQCNAVVGRFGGFVGKYMGDGILVYFGYPQAHEDDAERAVRTGLALVEAVGRLDDKPASSLKVRIGIATGLVVVGDLVGEGAAREQGVVGETPNLAARLQALAEPNTVMIAAGTRRLTGGLFEYRDFGPVAVKGFTEPVRVWEVLRENAVRSRFEAHHEAGLLPLAGREEEMDVLLGGWHQVTAGDGRVLLLCGEPGMGKSRLARDLEGRLAAESHTHLSWFCSPLHQDSALYPVIGQLRRAAGFAREDTPDDRLAKLEGLLRRSTTETEEIALIAALLSIPTDTRYPSLNYSPQQQKKRTLEALVTQLVRLAAQHPVLLLFEDVHWVDPTSRELLQLIIDRIQSLPVLLIITFRPQFKPPWTGHAHATMLVLKRLRNRHVAQIIEQISRKRLPVDVSNQIIGRADGVPLFVEELTKTVVESGLLSDAGDEYVLTGPLRPQAIPTTLHDSLMARLDRLPMGKEVVQVAAALGREFSYGLIRATTDTMSEARVREALERLVALELVYRRGVPPDAVYTFKHALVQEAAYGTLLRSKRQELHARIATVLEERFADVVEHQPELLANHCTLGGLTEKAIAYWGIAGRKSAVRSAMIEAVAQLRKGLDLLPNLPDGLDRWSHERDLQSALGAALYASQGPGAPETGQAYARARKLCEQLEDSAALIPVLSGQWSYHSARSEYQTAREIAEELLRLAQGKNDPAGLLVGSRSMGTCLYLLGEFALSRKYFEQVLTLYDANLHQSIASVAAFDPRAAALSYLSWNLFVLGYPDQALSWSKQALIWSRQLRHPHSLGYTLTWAAIFNLLRRADQQALRLLQELTALGNEQRFPHYVAAANIMRGHVIAAGGETTEGVKLAQQGFADMLSTGLIWNQTYFLGLMAQSCERAGQIDEASALLARALEMADRTGERWFEAELHRYKGEWLVVRDQRHQSDSEICFDRALDIAKRQSAKSWELRAAMNLSSLWCRRGKPAEARELLAHVYSWFSEGFDSIDLKGAKALLEELSGC